MHRLWLETNRARRALLVQSPSPGLPVVTVTIRAGGQTVDTSKPVRGQATILDEWDRAVRAMLAAAVASGPGRERVKKMRAWIEANPFHDKYNERHEQYWFEKMAANEEDAKLMDMTARVSRLQGEMSEETLYGLGALVGIELYPNISQMWARYAQRLATHDVFEITRQWLVDQRKEDVAA